MKYHSATGPVVPFIPTFAKQLGYSASIVGQIYFLLPIVGMIAKPLFGYIADRFNRHKFLFILFQVITLLAFAGITFIEPVPAETSFHCHFGEKSLEFCSPKVDKFDNCTSTKLLHNSSTDKFKCKMSCHKNQQWPNVCPSWNLTNEVPGLCELNKDKVDIDVFIRRDHIVQSASCIYFLFHNGTIDNHFSHLFCPGQDHEDGYLYKMDCGVVCEDDFINDVILEAEDGTIRSSLAFKVFVTLLALAWAGMAVVVSLGDAICFGMIGTKDTTYGHQRVWGSLGWGTFSFITGFLIDVSSPEYAKNYAIGFYIMGVLIIADLYASSKLVVSPHVPTTNFWGDMYRLIREIRVVVFFLWCIVSGLGCAMVWNFLFWHLEVLAGCEKLHMKTLQGLVMAFQCFFGEVPFFFWSGNILDRFGHVVTMTGVLFAYGLRFLLYSWLSSPWWVLPIELLNGLTFGGNIT